MEKITLDVNDLLKIKNISDHPILILTVEAKENKYNTFIIKKDSKQETVLAQLTPNESKNIKQTVNTDAELRLLSDNESSTDKITINYIILADNNNINNIKPQHNVYNDTNEEEDEEFEEEEEESSDDKEDEESLEAESDLAQIANDLWEECEAEFENEQFIGRKRYIN